MPIPKSCINLFKCSAIKVSELIVQCCKETEKWCTISNLLHDRKGDRMAEILQVKCEYMFPQEIQIQMLETSLDLWQKMKADLNFSEDQEKTVYLFMHYFCLRNYKGKFVMKWSDQESIDFLTTILPNILELRITCEVSNDILEVILSALKDLISLDLSFGYSGECLPVIGKVCCNLQTLRMTNTSSIDDKLAYRFCFPEHPNNSVASPVCTSLRYLHASCYDSGYAVLLENVKNLRILGNVYNDYKFMIKISQDMCRSFFPCNLTQTAVCNAGNENEDTDFDELYRKFPNLRKLFVISKGFCSAICKKTIETLMLVSTRRNDLTTDLPVCFSSSWPNLTVLCIGFPTGMLVKINLTVVSQNCTNLDTLLLQQCMHDPNKRFVPFKNLRNLTAYGPAQTYGVISEQATTLMVLEFHALNNSELRQFLSILTANGSLPSMNQLCHSPMLNTKEEILQLLNRFPALESYGIVKNDDLRSTLEQECQILNWDLTFHKKWETSVLRIFASNTINNVAT